MLDKRIMNGLWILAVPCFVVLVFAVSSVQAEDPYGIVWSRQLGTNVGDYSYSVAVDANGSAFITGTTEGSLGGKNREPPTSTMYSWPSTAPRARSPGRGSWEQIPTIMAVPWP